MHVESSLFFILLIVEIIERGLELAKHDGVLYLGTCGPEYKDNITEISYSSNKLVQYRRGAHYCTHAIAYTKWRARKYWGELATYRFMHGETGSDKIAREWQILTNTYPFTVGANVHWPPGSGHYGFFYQARGVLGSVIQGWEKLP